MKEIKLEVEGIMCINCVNKVNAALSGLEGCESSAVSEDFKYVYVSYDEERLTAGRIAGSIENIREKSFHVLKLEEE